MKLLVLLFMIASAQSFASEVCNFEETFDFAQVHTEIGKSDKLESFTALEKQMIHAAVNLQSWRGELSLEDALREFMDMDEDETEPGFLAGAVVYFKVNGKKIALVTYYPGDNEYGAFFEVAARKFKMIAEVSDSFIECK